DQGHRHAHTVPRLPVYPLPCDQATAMRLAADHYLVNHHTLPWLSRSGAADSAVDFALPCVAVAPLTPRSAAIIAAAPTPAVPAPAAPAAPADAPLPAAPAPDAPLPAAPAPLPTEAPAPEPPLDVD